SKSWWFPKAKPLVARQSERGGAGAKPLPINRSKKFFVKLLRQVAASDFKYFVLSKRSGS
ncbi:MAG: hypothetical protein ACI4JM_11135, partial [Oscillospiraceae bacterium]